MFGQQRFDSYDYSPEVALKLLLELQGCGVEDAFLTLLNSRKAEVSYFLPPALSPKLSRLHAIIKSSRSYTIQHDYNSFVSVVTNSNNYNQYVICCSPSLKKPTCSCPDFSRNQEFECKHLIGRRLRLFTVTSPQPILSITQAKKQLSDYDDLF